MIPEIDDALRTIVREEALQGSDVEVVFDAPTTDWAARRNSPTVNMYLYDLREDPRWRERGFVVERGDDGAVTARRPPNRRFKLSYLVTAWTQRPEDEHTLLGLVLANLVRFDAIPAVHLDGNLEGAHVPMTVGLPPPGDRSAPDLWNALGGELKPALDVVLVAPLTVATTQVAGPPVEGRQVRVGDR